MHEQGRNDRKVSFKDDKHPSQLPFRLYAHNDSHQKNSAFRCMDDAHNWLWKNTCMVIWSQGMEMICSWERSLAYLGQVSELSPWKTETRVRIAIKKCQPEHSLSMGYYTLKTYKLSFFLTSSLSTRFSNWYVNENLNVKQQHNKCHLHVIWFIALLDNMLLYLYCIMLSSCTTSEVLRPVFKGTYSWSVFSFTA